MKIINLKANKEYLYEYVNYCLLEWGKDKVLEDPNLYVEQKIKKIIYFDDVISVLGLIDQNKLIGFISLLKHDGNERKDLTPWYATMYVKAEYRNKGYSKILNEAIIKEAKKIGYNRIYLKSNLINYYEKFGAIYMHDLECGEKLYYIDCA